VAQEAVFGGGDVVSAAAVCAVWGVALSAGGAGPAFDGDLRGGLSVGQQPGGCGITGLA
jgi:hypothetical protein